MKPSESKYIKFRAALIGLFFTLLFSIIAGKAIYLQTYRGSWLSKKAARQYEKSYISYGKRGSIYDRQHREMAISNQVTSIAAHPPLIQKPGAAAKTLAANLNLKRQVVYRKLVSKKSFVWIKRHVSPGETKNLKKLNLNGVVFKPEQSRFYPNKRI
ncbi:MAG: penicillin-binding protein 2, partial [Deltaproteobacteria bacterium]|nr:penicillin-binding protein 2 [Deltaproteobacteria bacterium]